MKIHYISHHAVLEQEEVSLFTELGHSVFSNGAYLNPKGHYLLPRPEIKGAQYFENYHKLATFYPRTDLPLELIDPFDVIIVMNSPEIIDCNFKKFTRRKLIWRTIGQNTPNVEKMMKPYRSQGMKIVRMSPKERLLTNYIGEDALIRFYKDPEEYKDWNGNNRQVINITQTLKGRRDFCHYNHIMQIIEGFSAKIFGSGNEDLGTLNGGGLEYKLLKEQLRDNRVFVYAGTWPSPYTLSLIEAMMTGIPVIAIGKEMVERQINIPDVDKFEFYEVHEIIKNGVNGFCSDNIDHLRGCIEKLMTDYDLAKRIGQAGRQTAIDLFAKENAKKLWADFFNSI